MTQPQRYFSQDFQQLPWRTETASRNILMGIPMGLSSPLMLPGQEKQLGTPQALHSLIPHQLDFFNLPAIHHFLITTGLQLPK